MPLAAPGPRSVPCSGSTALEPRGRSPNGRRRSGGRASLLTAAASPSSSTRRSRRSGCWMSSAARSPGRASSPAIRIGPRGCPTAFMSPSVRTPRAVVPSASSRTRSMAPAAPHFSSTDPGPLLRSAGRQMDGGCSTGTVGALMAQDVWVYSADDRTSTPFLQGSSNELSATLLDGCWVVYASDESGRAEGVRAAVSWAWHPEPGVD